MATVPDGRESKGLHDCRGATLVWSGLLTGKSDEFERPTE